MEPVTYINHGILAEEPSYCGSHQDLLYTEQLLRSKTLIKNLTRKIRIGGKKTLPSNYLNLKCLLIRNTILSPPDILLYEKLLIYIITTQLCGTVTI